MLKEKDRINSRSK